MEAKNTVVRRRHAEEFRVEAVRYYLKAREVDPKRTIRGCAAELGVNARRSTTE